MATSPLAKAIVEDISSFEKVEVSHEEAQRLWAKRSSDDIINARKVMGAKFIQEDLGKHTNVIMACTDMTQVAVASLRAAGFEVLIAREFLHTYAKMLYREKRKWTVFMIDPQEEKRSRFRKMTPADRRREESCKRQGSFAEGESLAQIGLRSYQDFFRDGSKYHR